jgi:glycosyltransferase involved in cell wall biosynthesis
MFINISVLMPIFNSKPFLKDSIQSILNQTYRNFELLILDDGSSDFPDEIINGFDDSRIKYYREDENKGIVFQLNKGISLSKGKYIARMDADDVSLPDRFEKQIYFFEDPINSKIDILGTNAVKIGNEFGVIDFKNYRPKQISFMLNFYCALLHPTVMMRKSIFDNGLRYSENYKYAEDYALWRMVDNGKNIAILPNQLLEYRIHKGQTNQDIGRLQIQLDSCLKVVKLKSVRCIEKYLFTPKLKELFIYIRFGLQNNLKPNIFQRNYIKFMKRYLGIKSELLNNIINK